MNPAEELTIEPKGWQRSSFEAVKIKSRTPSGKGYLHEAGWLHFNDWMGRSCMVYAERMVPSGEDLPCILHAIGGGQKVCTADLTFWANQGYACASFDWQIGDIHLREAERTSQWPEAVVAQFAKQDRIEQCVLPLAIQAAQATLSWLLQHPATHPEKVGMSGISWGGYLTWATAVYDKRIRAICPVYGCGIFSSQDESRPFSDEVRNYWKEHWDPQALAPKQTAPAAYLSAANDFFGNVMQADRLLSKLPVDSRWSLLPNSDHSIGPREGALASAWMGHYLKGSAVLPGQPVLTPGLHIQPDTSQTIASTELWWTNSVVPPRFACWNNSPADHSARMAFAKVNYTSGLSVCSSLLRLEKPTPPKSLPQIWETLPDGIGWRWELGNTQHYDNAVAINPIDGGREIQITPCPHSDNRPLALLLHQINDSRWQPAPGDVLHFKWHQPTRPEKITAILINKLKGFCPEHEIDCPLVDGCYRIQLPAGIEWNDVFDIRIQSHGKRETFVFGPLAKISDPESM